MNAFFWMDDPATFNPIKDTTYLFIHEYLKRNINVFYITDISMTPLHLKLSAKKIAPFKKGDRIKVSTKTESFIDNQIDVIWLRKDPPVNEAYIRDLLIFMQFSKRLTFI